MRTVQFPGCCTGKVVKDFGGTNIAEHVDEVHSVEEIKEFLGQVIFQNERSGNAFICAVTNSHQTEANVALNTMGFRCTPWVSKDHHPETKVKMWWYDLGGEET